MKVGDKMYRVIENLTPDDGMDGWVVQSRTVKVVTKKTFTLNRPFSFCSRSYGRLPHAVVGSAMFSTEKAALQAFADAARAERSHAVRQIAEADRMTAWVTKQDLQRDRRNKLVEFIASAKPILCAWCGQPLTDGKCMLCTDGKP